MAFLNLPRIGGLSNRISNELIKDLYYNANIIFANDVLEQIKKEIMEKNENKNN